MDLAEGETVLNYWDASNFVVGNDVRRIEELRMPQPADRTLAAIGVNDDVTKSALVEALASLGPRVTAQVQRRESNRGRIGFGKQIG